MAKNASRDVASNPIRRPDQLIERIRIRELLENWILWRDGGDWDRFAALWHSDGRMIATWFQASGTEFVAGCRRAFEGGLVGLHSLGGSAIDIEGTRAVAHTRMQIVQRGRVHDEDVTVTCVGRFVDALEMDRGDWKMLLRQPVYELDWMTPVSILAVPRLDATLLGSFPEGYRHLAYLQTEMGFTVSHTLPGTRGPEIASLNERMACWLASGDRRYLA